MSRAPIPSNKNRSLIKAWRQICIYSFPYKSLKVFSIKKTELKERVSFKNDQLIHDYLNENKDVIVVMGNYGNWEWGLLATTIHFDNQMVAIYKTLS